MTAARVVTFDVDDTLYLERDYVRSGFRVVATALTPSSEEQERLFGNLWNGFLAGRRGGAFDELLCAEHALAGAWTVEGLVRLYREHVPDIHVLPGIESLLDGLVRAEVRVGVITDGPVAVQRRKVQALGIRRWADAVVITDELPGRAPKPGHEGYLAVMDLLAAAGEECVYVGDNPKKDFRGARQLGWWTVRLRLPDQLHETREAETVADAADEEVHSVVDLEKALARRTELSGK